MDSSDYIVSDTLSAAQTAELHGMLAQEWWSRNRDLESVRDCVRNSGVVVALLERATGGLAGFARVVTDFRYFAVILDVVVRSDLRGNGLGARVMDEVIGHPRLQQLAGIGLSCAPELTPFYERWGFAVAHGRSRRMTRPMPGGGS